LYHIYDLTTYELKSTFGSRGEGPNDFVVPWLLHTNLSDFFITDNNYLHRFEITGEGQAVLKGVEEAAYISGLNEAAFINDSLYVQDGRYLSPSLHLLTLKDEMPRKSWTYRNPDIMDYYVDPDMGNVYANESRIVLCYGYKKQIDFMDTGLNMIKRVKFNYTPPSDISSQKDGDVKASYGYNYLGKRYLYALFFGTSWNEYRAQLTHGTYLEVYDLDGNPVIKYYLDGRSPAHFAVDEKTFTLYGPGDDGDPEDNLLVYKLKGLS
jgi:hypothetical protein